MSSNNYYYFLVRDPKIIGRDPKIIGVYVGIQNLTDLNNSSTLINVISPHQEISDSLGKNDLVFQIDNNRNNRKIYTYNGSRFRLLDDTTSLTDIDPRISSIVDCIGENIEQLIGANIEKLIGQQKYIKEIVDQILENKKEIVDQILENKKKIVGQSVKDKENTFGLFNTLIRLFEIFVDVIVTNPTILKINSLKYDEFNTWLNTTKHDMNISIDEQTLKITYETLFLFLKELLYIPFEEYKTDGGYETYDTFMKDIYYRKIMSKKNENISFDKPVISVHIKHVANIFKEIYKIVEENVNSSESTYTNIVNKIIDNIATKMQYMCDFFNKPISDGIYPSDVIKNFDINNIQLINSLNTFINKNSSNKILTLLKINCYPLEKYNQRFQLYLKKKDLQTTNYDNSIVVQYNDKNAAYYDNNGDFLTNLPNPLHNKNYVFGNFSKIYRPETSNEDIVKSMPSIIEQIESGKPVFIMGYGASGSGKTSSLIYLHFKDKKKDGSIIDKKKDGIIIELCKTIGEKNYKTIELTTIEIGASEVPKNTCTPNTVVNDAKEVQCVNKFTYDKDKNNFFHNDSDMDKPTPISEFMYDVFEKNRFIRPTANNPISSRTHVIAFLKFINNPGTSEKTGYLIVGDLAGIENRFNEENVSTVIDFFNKYDTHNKEIFENVMKELSKFNYEYLGGGKTNELWKNTFNQLALLLNNDDSKNLVNNDDSKNLEMPIPKNVQFNVMSNWYKNNKDNLTKINKNKVITNAINYLNENYEVALNEYNEYITAEEKRKRNEEEERKRNAKNKREAERKRQQEEIAKKQAKQRAEEQSKREKEAIAKRNAEAIAKRKQEEKEKEQEEIKIQEEKEKKIADERNNIINELLLISLIKIDENFLTNALERYGFMGYQSSYKNLIKIFRNKVNQWLMTIFDRYLKDCIILDKSNIFKLNMVEINKISTSTFIVQLKNTIELLSKNIDDKRFTEIQNEFDKKYITRRTVGDIDIGHNDTNRGDFPNLTYKTNRQEVLNKIKAYIKKNPTAKISRDILDITITYMNNNNNYLVNLVDKTNNEDNIHYTLLFENEQKPKNITSNIKDINNILNTLHDIFYILKKRIEKGVKICENRIKEGEYINDSLEKSREDIKNIFHHKSKDDMFSSPEFVNQCLDKYCPTHSDCFSKKNNENISYELKSTIFQEIHKYLKENDVLTVDASIKDLFNKILVCVFCVFNISRSANNPPPTPYIDINELKIDVMKYNKNKDDPKIRKSLAENIAKTFYKITGKNLAITVPKDIREDINIEYSHDETVFDNTQTVYIKNSDSFKFLFTVEDNTWDSKFVDNLISKIYSESVKEAQDRDTYNRYEQNLTEFINCIDKNNTVSAIGTLEFLDKISKYFATNVICSVKTKEYDFTRDYELLYPQ
jgi:hypothetical protein